MSLKLFLKHKKSLKHDFVKISEVLITKHRNSLRNDVVRFPEEIFVKKRSGLRNGFMKLPLIMLFPKIPFAKITEELVMKYKDN